MTALLTACDRQRLRLRREIAPHRQWLRESDGRRETAFHMAKIAEMESELNRLEGKT